MSEVFLPNVLCEFTLALQNIKSKKAFITILKYIFTFKILKGTPKTILKEKKVDYMFGSESVLISPHTTVPHVDMGHEDIGVLTCIFSTSVDCLPNKGSSSIL